jgi:hypothetical protein
MPYRNKKNEPKRTPKKLLELFSEICQELRESRLFRQGLETSIVVNWNSDSDLLQSELKNHDADDLRSFLTIFRKFTSENSHIFVNKIYKLCPQYLSDEELKRAFAGDYEIWLKIQNKSEWDEKRVSYKIRFNGKEHLPKELADKWMNGFVFHDDLQAKEFFKNLSPSNLDIIKWSINSYINSSTTHILNLSEGINMALKKRLFTFPVI